MEPSFRSCGIILLFGLIPAISGNFRENTGNKQAIRLDYSKARRIAAFAKRPWRVCNPKSKPFEQPDRRAVTFSNKETGTPGNGNCQKLAILMIAPQPFFRSRGTPFSVLHRIRALLLSGHSVDLVTYPFGEPVPLEGLNIIRSRKVPFIQDVHIGPSIAKFFLDIPLYFAARKQLRTRKYDLIHSHEEAAFFSAGLAAKYRIKHIYDMHSSLPQQLSNFGRFNLAFFRSLFERLERYVLESCDGVITICSDLADKVDALGIQVPHSMIENTADDTKVFPSKDVDVVKKFSLSGKKIVLYTGTFEAYQGLDLLIDAFRKVVAEEPDAHLLLVGGRPEQVEAMRQHVEDLGLDHAVSFSGTVPSNEIASYLKTADVIASPRVSGTNTPLKLYGYMRSGVPMVATDKHTHTQTLDSRVAQLVPASVDGMADGILTLLNDREHALSLAGEAKRKAEETYSDAAYLARVAVFYCSVFRAAGECENSVTTYSTTTTRA